MSKQTWMIAILLGVLASPAHADDHMIRPTCWEENRDGRIYRHCEVNRPQAAAPAVPAAPPVADATPPAIPALPPAMQPYPAQAACFYRQLPCAVYYDRPPPAFYGPPPPYGFVPGPLAVFRVGPFSIVVP